MTAPMNRDLFWRLIEISTALSGERNTARLFERILDAAQDITHADGGTLYLLKQKNGRMALEFEIQADSKEVHFFDAASVCACDPADGFHLSAEAHRNLGLALAAEVMAMGWPAK